MTNLLNKQYLIFLKILLIILTTIKLNLIFLKIKCRKVLLNLEINTIIYCLNFSKFLIKTKKSKKYLLFFISCSFNLRLQTK